MTTGFPSNVRLDDLIEGIRRARPGDPGSQLGEAVVVGEHLGELADHLVGHFVEEARRGKHAVIAPAHLILGLLHEQEGLAWRALAASGETADGVRAAVSAALPTSEGEPPALIPFAAPAKKALELTFRQALRLGDASVGTQHLLLALLELENGDGPLSGLGLDVAGVERTLATLDGSEEDDAAGADATG